jgi:hypothetical protein
LNLFKAISVFTFGTRIAELLFDIGDGLFPRAADSTA